jgi:REP-associated tyrosine transposase
MKFEKGKIYHIFNQGNNRRKVFFNRRNYFYFLKKIEKHVKPYSDFLAYCLMPNHFHLMVLVNEVELELGDRQGFTQNIPEVKKRSLNHSIGILLRSYTRAINKQENFTGSLFRKETKAACVNCSNDVSPFYLNIDGNYLHTEKSYLQVCFDYIHNNPVNSGLVKQDIDWEFSSARDYYTGKLRSDSLINKDVAKRYFF